MNTTLCIIGAGGRMGRMLTAAAFATPGLEVAAATEIPGSPLIGQDAGELAGVGKIGVPVSDPDATEPYASVPVIDLSGATQAND